MMAVRCPKCRSTSFSYSVVCEEEFTSDVVDGQLTFMGQSDLPVPVRACATCTKCGHYWQFRKVPYTTEGALCR